MIKYMNNYCTNIRLSIARLGPMKTFQNISYCSVNALSLTIFLELELDKWAFMSSPIPVLSLLAAYLYFVLRLGPRYMETKRPFRIRYIMMAYNLFQVAYNARMCLNVSIEKSIAVKYEGQFKLMSWY